MRVLITSFAHNTHFLGCVPLAWALRVAGHEVRFATHPGFTKWVTDAGLTAVPVGSDHRYFGVSAEETVRIMAELGNTDLTRYSTNLDLAGRPEVLSREFLHGLDAGSVSGFYSVVNDEAFASGLVEFAREWSPDIVLWEQFTFAGAIAARACGAASGRVLWGSDLTGYFRREYLRQLSELEPEQRRDPLRDWLTELSAPYGVEFGEDLVVGDWSIDPLPAPFRLDTGLRTIPMRYIPYNGPAVVPEWLKKAGERRRVCVTTGNSGTHFTADARTHHRFLTTLAGVDAEIVVTADEARLRAVGPLPDNVRVVGFAPLHVLLEHCEAVIHHGGAGSWSTALHCGVPQINLPFLWDAVVRAQQLEAEGAGLHLSPAEVTAEELRAAVERVLDEPSFRENAQRLRQESSAEASLHDVVRTLEDTVRTR
ncbi:activator-dependent family glycosyltransferase [Streptomyces sp. NPDC101150]|uniref:activator-dependent family glycosyltransferase n=1 Tax=Streptomyces sp. NPDC101150 TaxID=3366114 RepID=UPI00381C48CD